MASPQPQLSPPSPLHEVFVNQSLALRTGLHDLGNLLQVVLAASEEGVLPDATPGEQRCALEASRAAARRAVELVRTLASEASPPSDEPPPRRAEHAGFRNLSRRNGKSGISPSPSPTRSRPPRLTELYAVVQDAVALIRAATRVRIHIEATSEERRAAAQVDPGMLHRVLINLLKNGCEALEERGAIVVRIRRLPEDRATIEVADDGAGMDAETLAQATRVGYSSRGPGRGLGLAFVQSFARAAGGEVQIESRAGYGTSVRLELPDEGPRRPVPVEG